MMCGRYKYTMSFIIIIQFRILSFMLLSFTDNQKKLAMQT